MPRRLLFPVMLLCMASSLEAGANEARMVFTSPGQDATRQVHISWHSDLDDNRLEYTRRSNPGYVNATTVSGEAMSRTQDTTTFSSQSFHRYHVTLDDPDSGTEYIFRIGTSVLSQDHHFKTAGGYGEFSFIFMSDVHAYPSIPSRVNRAISLVDEATQQADALDFILFTGDLTAHGANYTEWEHLASAPFTGAFMMATTPGNHDYYNSAADTIDDRFYNAVFRNPDNGAPAAMNTTYWFRHHGAIFISLNTEANSTAQLNSQRAWLQDVIDTNPAQYYIAYAHRAFFLGSTTTPGGGVVRKSSDSYGQFGLLLEELGVDLVLAGHNHVYVRTKPMSGGEVAPDGEGTVYITANQIGDRGRMAASSLGEYGEAIYGGDTESNSISTLSVIHVTDTAIHGQMFDANGVVHDSYTIPARREPMVDDFDPEAYMNSFSAHVNPEDLSLGILRFTAEGHHRVRTIALFDAEIPEHSYASFTPTEGMTQSFFGPLEAGLTYAFTLVVSFRDGSQGTAPLSLINKLHPGTVEGLRVETVGDWVFLVWDNHLVSGEIQHIHVALEDDWSASLPGDATSVDITAGLRRGWNNVAFTVIDRYGDPIFSQELEYEHDYQRNNRPQGACGGCSASGMPGSMLLLWVAYILVAKRRRKRPLP